MRRRCSRRGAGGSASARLYFVCEGLPNGRDPAPLLDAALRGGVDVIQLREKAPRCAEELVSLAEPFARAARDHGALFFLNDTPDWSRPAAPTASTSARTTTPSRRREGPPARARWSASRPTRAEQFDAALEATGAARPDQISVGPSGRHRRRRGGRRRGWS